MARRRACQRASRIVALLAMAWPLLAGAAASDADVLAELGHSGPRDTAIAHGLAFLRAAQLPDGAVGATVPVAATALALLAHLAAGHAPDDREVGAFERRCLTFVLAHQDAHGYFGGQDNSRMYGHGIATLALAEAVGMTRDEDLEARLRRALERAVVVTVGAARLPRDAATTGGWHYYPDDPGADLSLSGWQLLSLHACAQVGVEVPADVISHGVDYARRLITPDGMVGYAHAGEDHAPLRGLALLCLAVGHRLDDPVAQAIAERMRSDPLGWQGPWFFYRAFYDAVGLSRAAPEAWAQLGPGEEKVLIDHQQADGSWPSPPGDDEAGPGGPAYLTAMATLALCVERQVLPAYQR